MESVLSILTLTNLIVLSYVAYLIYKAMVPPQVTPKVGDVMVRRNDGECPHESTTKLQVTQMGDDGEYYLCKICGQKVARQELTRLLK